MNLINSRKTALLNDYSQQNYSNSISQLKNLQQKVVGKSEIDVSNYVNSIKNIKDNLFFIEASNNESMKHYVQAKQYANNQNYRQAIQELDTYNESEICSKYKKMLLNNFILPELIELIIEGNDRINGSEKEAILLLGSTGSGKTTLTNLIGGKSLVAEDTDEGKLILKTEKNKDDGLVI